MAWPRQHVPRIRDVEWEAFKKGILVGAGVVSLVAAMLYMAWAS